MPVYEIYKVGEDPSWLPGLDLLGPATGLRAAVVPHYDNAEGGNHDTRFCYLGERRLRMLEEQLPQGAFVLGVDSHTALVLDLERRTAAVSGLGGVTVRVDGRSTVFPSGSEVDIDTLAEVAARPGRGRDGRHRLGAGPGRRVRIDRVVAGRRARRHVPPNPFATKWPTSRGRSSRPSATATAGRPSEPCSTSTRAIEARLRAGEDSPDLDNASATFRALIVRLGEAAAGGVDPRATVDPFVEALLDPARPSPGRPRLGDRRPHPRPADRGRGRGPRRPGGLDLGSRRGRRRLTRPARRSGRPVETPQVTLGPCHKTSCVRVERQVRPGHRAGRVTAWPRPTSSSFSEPATPVLV